MNFLYTANPKLSYKLLNSQNPWSLPLTFALNWVSSPAFTLSLPPKASEENCRSANPWRHQTNQCNRCKHHQYIFPILINAPKQERHKFQHPICRHAPQNRVYASPYTCWPWQLQGWRQTGNIYWKKLNEHQIHPATSGELLAIKQLLYSKFFNADYPGRPRLTQKLGKTSL